MGVKHLWSILSPYSERKSLSVLHGKTVAIDLSGWVCESLNVVNYFIHPRQHLKNLFYRACYLILENVTPVFVLEGDAPELKSHLIAKRNKVQFQGMQPNTKKAINDQKDEGIELSKEIGERQRFKQILKQCENLLKTMGIDCIQAPGEAEAFCAFLNKIKLVDGVISQDSDCFAYGATRVYRNFSISTQGSQVAKGGAIDVYDMEKIQQTLDFGQKKAIAMALFCGCDYGPTGVGGVGYDGVLKLFQKYREGEILDKIRYWRKDANKYKTLELRVDDKNICKNCGHIGSTQSHMKCGCRICCSNLGCNDMLWKEERLLIKTEIALRKKALSNPSFPSEEIISEFLSEPVIVHPLKIVWRKPNIVKFIKQIGPLLQWTEIYCFQKFFPILARWQIINDARSENIPYDICITPEKILRKRTLKGVSSVEMLWHAREDSFDRLIPDVQLQALVLNQSFKDINELRTTVEPLDLVEAAYPTLLESFYIQTEKSKCQRVNRKKQSKLHELNTLKDLATDKADAYKIKFLNKKKKPRATKNLQLIDKFLKPKYGRQKVPINNKNCSPPFKYFHTSKSSPIQCSTPKTKFIPSDLDSDNEIDIIGASNAIIDSVKRPMQRDVTLYTGCNLKYETVILATRNEISSQRSKDDLNFLTSLEKNRLKTNRFLKSNFSKDDSFDILSKSSTDRLKLSDPDVLDSRTHHI